MPVNSSAMSHPPQAPSSCSRSAAFFAHACDCNAKYDSKLFGRCLRQPRPSPVPHRSFLCCPRVITRDCFHQAVCVHGRSHLSLLMRVNAGDATQNCSKRTALPQPFDAGGEVLRQQSENGWQRRMESDSTEGFLALKVLPCFGVVLFPITSVKRCMVLDCPLKRSARQRVVGVRIGDNALAHVADVLPA